MQDLADQYQEMHSKIKDECNKKNLEFSWIFNKFPVVGIVARIKENPDQMRMEEFEDELTGEIKFIFSDELIIQVTDDFTIGDSELNSLKNKIKKLHYLFLQVKFKQIAMN